MNQKLKKVTSSIGKICDDKKRCCVHKCCNSQEDEGCCSNCEPLASQIEWSHEKGFHVIEDNDD